MLLDSFRNYLQFERNYSEHTLTAYTRDLKGFADFLQEYYEMDLYDREEVDLISHKPIRLWMGEMLEQGLTRKSVARKIAAVSTYFKFLRKMGVVEKNPAARVKAPKVEKALPVFVREKGMQNLFHKVKFPDTLEGVRDKCILEVLYGCGLRRSELIGLTWKNIDFRQMTLKVLGKGNKERILPFGDHVRQSMEVYMQACENEGLNYKGQFFVKKDGKPVYPVLVSRMVDKYLNLASSLQKRSPHVLRHTFATHLLDNGADLNAIKELLGHTSLAATQVYVHNSITKLKNIHNKSHPKS